MKFLIAINILIIFIITPACGDDKRIPIKAIETKNGYYEWYYYSLITSSGPDFIDYVDENCKRTLVYKGHRVNDLRLEKGKLFIECFQCNTIKLNPTFQNQICLIENNDPFDYSDSSLKRDSLKRNYKQRECK
jgi:hypothetical protein